MRGRLPVIEVCLPGTALLRLQPMQQQARPAAAAGSFVVLTSRPDGIGVSWDTGEGVARGGRDILQHPISSGIV